VGKAVLASALEEVGNHGLVTATASLHS
jgi:hypothetical protein